MSWLGEETWWRGSLVESILYVRVLDVKILKLLRLEINFIRAKVELGWKFKQIGWLRISLEKICNYFRKMQPSINEMSEKFHCYICGGFCAYLGSELVQIRLTLDFNSSLDSIDRERDLFRVFHYIKMISVLKTFFFLILTLILFQSLISRIVVCTLVGNWDHVTFHCLSILFPYILPHEE